MPSRLCEEDAWLAFGLEIPNEEEAADGLDALPPNALWPNITVPRTGSEATMMLIVRSTSDQYISAVKLSNTILQHGRHISVHEPLTCRINFELRLRDLPHDRSKATYRSDGKQDVESSLDGLWHLDFP